MGFHGVRLNGRRGLFGPSWGSPGRRRRFVGAFAGDFAPAPRLPFLLLIEEKEAKEDQGDDRLQVGRIGAEIFEGFHGG